MGHLPTIITHGENPADFTLINWLFFIMKTAGFFTNHGWDYNLAVWAVHKVRVKRLRNQIETELKQAKAVLRAFGWNG